MLITDFILVSTGNLSCFLDIIKFLGKKVMTNLDSILKNRDITLPKKVHLVKGITFPIVMYESES